MLLIFSGTYGVGKTHFILYLSKHYGFKIIPTFVTRKLRKNETEKIHISKKVFEKLRSENQFLYFKEHFDEYYGIKKKDIEFACSGSDFWMIDFPIEKINEIKGYQFKVIVILPIDKTQIIENLTIENRIDRIPASLEDYSTNYVNLSEKLINSNTLLIKNYFNKFHQNIKSIIQFVNH